MKAAAARGLSVDEELRAIRDELLRRQAARDHASRFAKYEHDPIGFTHDVLGDMTWEKQDELLTAIDEHRRVHVMAGQKVSKSRTAVEAAIWWVETRPQGLVVFMSGNGQQVKGVLWAELRTLYVQAGGRKVLGGGEMPLDPQTGWWLGPKHGIVGITAADAERAAGWSGADLLVFLDESSAISDDIHEAIMGNMLSGGRLVALGNPTQSVGWFVRAAKSSEYHRIRISSRDTPNARTGTEVIRGLAKAETIAETERIYGADSDVVRVRIDGLPPTQGDNNVVGIGAWESAKRRWRELMDDASSFDAVVARLRKMQPRPKLLADRLHVGVDPARFGDDESAINARRGRFAYPAVIRQGFDTTAVAGEVLRVAALLRRDDRERPVVNVDVNGVGAGVADQLRRHEWLEVCDVDSSSNAKSDAQEVTDDNKEAMKRDNYHRRRDQGWWGLRTWLAEGGMVPPDDKLEEEALAPTYGFDAENRIQVESKKETKKRLGRSPDRADALWLSIQRARTLAPFKVRTA